MNNQHRFTLRKALKHLRVVHTHRLHVLKFCFKARLYRQGLFHDLSKYSPVEFVESVKYFTGTHSPIDECKKFNRYSAAWMHHKSHNKHHREYWTDNYDKGTTAVKMPYKYALECFCDYLGAGVAYNKGVEDVEGEVRWWKSQREHIKIHPDTLSFLDCMFILYETRGSSFLKDRKVMKNFKISYENSSADSIAPITLFRDSMVAYTKLVDSRNCIHEAQNE